MRIARETARAAQACQFQRSRTGFDDAKGTCDIAAKGEGIGCNIERRIARERDRARAHAERLSAEEIERAAAAGGSQSNGLGIGYRDRACRSVVKSDAVGKSQRACRSAEALEPIDVKLSGIDGEIGKTAAYAHGHDAGTIFGEIDRTRHVRAEMELRSATDVEDRVGIEDRGGPTDDQLRRARSNVRTSCERQCLCAHRQTADLGRGGRATGEAIESDGAIARDCGAKATACAKSR